jgi:hypothetical protein
MHFINYQALQRRRRKAFADVTKKYSSTHGRNMTLNEPNKRLMEQWVSKSRLAGTSSQTSLEKLPEQTPKPQ